MARAIDWQRYDALRAEGLSGRQIAEVLGIAESTLRGLVKRRKEHQRQAFTERVSAQTPGVSKRVSGGVSPLTPGVSEGTPSLLILA